MILPLHHLLPVRGPACLAALIVCVPAAALAGSGTGRPAAARPSSPLVQALARCLDVADDRARLACTDRAARALVDAEQARDVVVVDRGEVRQARRSLFGLSVDASDVFAGRAAPADRITTLDTSVRSAAQGGYGNWTLTLAEGGRWRTLEPWSAGAPRPGQAASVRAGSLGSYFLKVADGRWLRAQRVN